MTKISWQLVSILALTAACGSPAVDVGNTGAPLDNGAHAHVDAPLPADPLLKSTQPASLTQSACTDRSALHALAEQQCAALGLPRIPSEFYGQWCGWYRSNSLSFLCAEEMPANSHCQTTYVGSAEACVDDAALLAKARTLSSDVGLAFADILYDHACGDHQSHWAQFEYCGSTDLVGFPEPTECIAGGLDTQTCIDPNTLVSMADEECSAHGQALVDYSFAAACTAQDTTVRSVKYECCPNSF